MYSARSRLARMESSLPVSLADSDNAEFLRSMVNTVPRLSLRERISERDGPRNQGPPLCRVSVAVPTLPWRSRLNAAVNKSWHLSKLFRAQPCIPTWRVWRTRCLAVVHGLHVEAIALGCSRCNSAFNGARSSNQNHRFLPYEMEWPGNPALLGRPTRPD
jgi:hypothetical protein